MHDERMTYLLLPVYLCIGNKAIGGQGDPWWEVQQWGGAHIFQVTHNPMFVHVDNLCDEVNTTPR